MSTYNILFYLCWSASVALLLRASLARADPAADACVALTEALPQNVAFLLSAQYSEDNAHWAASSSQLSTCSVEPATVADVVTIIQVINQTRTPWAVKGGGHAYNPGFSSTPGVLIAMSKFNDVTYDASTSTARLGAGLVWDDVYAVLAPQGVTVVGGRVPGVGVAGIGLGGGYSWLTQQYGLTIDTVVAYELVTLTGKVVQVTEESVPDLFFGLRGGGNNFGIVTGFTLQTFPQGLVYGGALVYAGDLGAVTDAIVIFDANNKDPKASMIASYTAVAITMQAVVFVFYDGPRAPNGTFDEFLRIPTLLNSVKTQAYPDFVKSLAFSPNLIRADGQSVPIIRYTQPIMEEIINQAQALGSQLLPTPQINLFATMSVEPFMRNLFDRSRGGAYPHDAGQPWTPFQILVNSLNDGSYRERVLASAAAIQNVAIAEGQSSADAILYNNYAMEGTPLELMYGPNVGVLRKIRVKYDPYDLRNLTGGWRF